MMSDEPAARVAGKGNAMWGLSSSMWENLASEAIGMIVTAILFTWIGGKIAGDVAEREFNNRWSKYRATLAQRVKQNIDDLHNRMLWLANRVNVIGNKLQDEVSPDDLATYRTDYAALERVIEELTSFTNRHHFALREADIAAAQEAFTAISKLRRDLETPLHLKNFEAMLASHLEGAQPFDRELPREFFPGTRYEFMRANAVAAYGALREYPTDWMWPCRKLENALAK